MELREIIKNYRLKTGKSKRNMAKMTNISWQTISNFEEGKNMALLSTFEDICKYLNLEIVLLDEDGNRIQ